MNPAPLMMIVPIPVETMVLVGFGGILLFAVFFCFRTRSHHVAKRALAQIETADGEWKANPSSALKKYEVVIGKLEGMKARRPLPESGKQALGRAYFGSALLKLASKDTAEGSRLLSLAQACMTVESNALIASLAEIFFSQNEIGDEAIRYYAAFLALPASQTKESLARDIAARLQKELHIDRVLSRELRQRRAQWNKLLTRIPVSVPCLVVVSNDPTSPVRQYPLGTPVLVGETMPKHSPFTSANTWVTSTTIGRGAANNIVIADNTLSTLHASIEMKDGHFLLVDHGTVNGTRVKGALITEPTLLQDGDEILCGLTSCYFYIQPRAVGGWLDWTHYNLGVAAFCQGLYEAAEDELKTANILVPKRADTLWMLGLTAQARHAIAEAVQHFKSAVELDPKHHQARHAWGLALIQQAQEAPADSPSQKQQISEGIEHLKSALEIAPAEGDYAYHLARALAFVGAAKEAIAVLERAVQLHENRVEFHLLLASLTRKDGDFARSKQAAEKALSLDKDSLPGNWIAGCNSFDSSEYEYAAARLEKVRAMEIRRSKPTFSHTIDFSYRLGRSLFEVGRFEAASQTLSNISAQSREALFYSGRCQTQLGRFSEGAAIFEKMLQPDSQDKRARFYLAATYANLADYEKGLQILEPLETDSDWGARALCLGGKMLARMQKLDRAAEKYALALQAHPTLSEVQFEIARMAFLRGDYTAAEERLSHVLQAQGDHSESYYWLGQVQLAQGQLEVARDRLRACINACRRGVQDQATQSLQANAQFSLGWIEQTCGNVPEAIKCFTAARRLGGNQDYLLYYSALAHLQGGKLTEAVAELSALSLRKGLTTDQAKTVSLMLATATVRAAMEPLRGGRFTQAIPLLKQALTQFNGAGVPAAVQRVGLVLAEAYYGLGLHHLKLGLQFTSAKTAALIPPPAPAAQGTTIEPPPGSQNTIPGAEQTGPATLEEAGRKTAAPNAISVSGEGSSQQQFIAAEHLQNASQAFLRAQELGPKEPRFAFYCGYTWFRRGEYEKASECFRKIEGDEMWTAVANEACALTLEASNKLAEAEAVWRNSVKSVNGTWTPKFRMEVGFGGFLARRGQLKEAAHWLRKALRDERGRQQPFYRQVCKVAAVYFSLAGEQDLAAEVVKDHLRGIAPDLADTYLGALWAQQKRLDEAYACLDRALRSQQPSSDTRALLLAVNRARVAREVINNRLAEALRLLDQAFQEGVEMDPETALLRDRIQTALLLQDARQQPANKLMKVYETIYAKHPKNPRIKRNMAILYHKTALVLEESGSLREADEYWRNSANLWCSLAKEEHFWADYLATYNRCHQSRDQLKPKDLPSVRRQVMVRIAEVHTAFSLAYLRSATAPSSVAADAFNLQAPMTEVRRHLRYAKSLIDTEEYRKSLATQLLSARTDLQPRKVELLQLAEIVCSELAPPEDVWFKLRENLHLELASESLWREDCSLFCKHVKKLVQIFTGPVEWKKMVQQAASIEPRFILAVIRMVKGQFLPLIPPLVHNPAKQQEILFLVVLQIGAIFFGLDAYQRIALETKLSVVLAQIFPVIVQQALRPAQRLN